MKKKYKVGNNISFINGESWRFNNKVASNFDNHVVSSIPHYKSIQNYIANLSEWFIKENSLIYDIGCSTSNTTYEISKKNYKIRKLKFICIDENKKMIQISKKKLSFFKQNKYKFLINNVDKMNKFNRHDLSLCILLLPFLNNSKKLILLRKINKSLNSGGALIILDKIYADSSISENMFNQLYMDFKSDSFSKNEIWNKSKLLRSSMNLNTNDQNFQLFKKSGFKKFEIFFRWFNFCGYIIYK